MWSLEGFLCTSKEVGCMIWLGLKVGWEWYESKENSNELSEKLLDMHQKIRHYLRG